MRRNERETSFKHLRDSLQQSAQKERWKTSKENGRAPTNKNTLESFRRRLNKIFLCVLLTMTAERNLSPVSPIQQRATIKKPPQKRENFWKQATCLLLGRDLIIKKLA